MAPAPLRPRLLRAARLAVAASPARAASWWAGVQPAAKDPILGVTEAFLADAHPDKVNVGVGAYRSDAGKPVVLDCVRQAEARIAGQELMEYAPMGGSATFNGLSAALAYGDGAPVLADRRVAAVQSLSGTGACRLFADFQKRVHPEASIFIPTPTWANHHNIWRDAHVAARPFRYYDPATRGLDFKGLMEDVNAAPSGSFFLLHACAHNPTGVDPTAEQWKEMSALFKKKELYAFFDMAYQGFATGDLVRDAQAIRIFVDDGHQVACSQSYAKNMGLYGQRIGCLSVVCDDEKQAVAVKSQLQQIARPMYSNPPVHGAMLVSKILADSDLKELWHKEVKDMADRIISMRHALREHLEKEGSNLPWQHITDQIGMFCFSSLSPEQVDRLTSQFHIYLTRNGRISMAGVTSGNVAYLAHAMHEVTKEQAASQAKAA
eukprot:SM000018S03723  [mRNA]  locus=s18:1045783:1048302:+ [translate_table: standard]